MAALPADIGAASRDIVTATWADPVIAARYPTSRDASTSTAEGYFDALADATKVVNARGALIGTERRRFTADVDAVVWPSVSTGLPQVQLVDAEQGASAGFLAARIEIDLEAGTTSFELFG